MSKSRTGRKGRIRLAIAAGLQDVESGEGGGNTVVDSAGRLGASSGFLSSDDDKSNAVILDYIQGQLNKPGTANALFAQGEVRGPLADSVDTQNGATGAISSADSGNFASASGETSAAAIAPLSTGDGTFAHYVLPDSTEAATNLATAVAAAAPGGTFADATTGQSQVAATELRGICYHQGGPGSDLVPVMHSGAAAANDMAATQLVINPSQDTIWGDSGVISPTHLRLEILGRTCVNSGGVAAGDNGDAITYYKTDNTVATSVFKFTGTGVNGDGRGGATSNGFPVGGLLKIRDENGDVLLTIEGAETATNGLTATDAGSSGNVQDKNFNVSSSSLIYVVAHESTGGATAYPAGTANDDSMGGFVGCLAAAITAWGSTYGAKISAAQGTGTGGGGLGGRSQLTISYDSLKGTAGNNSTNSAEAALTVTAYQSSSQVVAPGATGGKHDWFLDSDGSTVTSYRRFGADDGQAGANGTNFDTLVATVSTTDVDTGVNIPIQDLPVRVAYTSDDAAREGLSSGIPAESAAGFVIIWGPVTV